MSKVSKRQPHERGKIFGCLASVVALAILWGGDGALAQQCTTTGTNQTCTNSILLFGGASGVFDNATLTVTNFDTGTIAGTTFGINAADTANLTNFGTVLGGVFGINATNAANIINFGTISGIIGVSASASNVTTNVGSISGSVFGISASTAVVNNSGSISGGVTGIFATNTSVVNSGTVLAGAGGTGISATGTASVTNSGTISDGAYGIFATNAAVSNSGTISGSIAGINATAANVTNIGTIVGGTGISLGGNSAVFNAGTIVGSGGIAIDFVNGANTLTLGPGFAISGQVTGTGNNTFQLGGTGIGIFDLGLIGPAQQYEGFSQFNKVGPSTWTVIGTYSQSDPWDVQIGTLLVDGDLSAASGVTVRSGAILGGTGTVSDLTINNGGTFAPGTPGTSMAVLGNLAFQSGAIYVAQINPQAASLANVSGTATLSGGNVLAAIAPGDYVQKQYHILHAAGGLNGTFATATSSAPGFVANLDYTPTDVFLSLTAGLGAGGGLNVNQANVANAVNNFFNGGGALPPGFSPLFRLSGNGLANALTQLSGEAATGWQQSTVDAMNLFLGVLTDPFIAGRGSAATSGSAVMPFAETTDIASAYASNGRKSAGAERDAYAAVSNGAPRRPAGFDQSWSIWAAGFGGSQTTDGNLTLGSNETTYRVGGVAIGADYRFSPNTLAGFALAGGGTNFSLANGLGSGRSDLFQAGAFVRHVVGPAYISAALAYGWQDATTERIVTVAGIDQLSAKFNANAFSGRVEGGYRFVTPWIGLTPYAAGQFTTFDLPTYAEQATVGTNAFALGYASKNVIASRSELGLRVDKSFAMQDGILTLRGRAAWARDYNTNRNVTASFLTLSDASFVVNGATPANDAALVTASAEMKWLSGFSLSATFEGGFSNVTQSYAGKGAVRYQW